MEYQKIINLLRDTPDQPSKFRTNNWVEINDDSRGMYNINSQIKFKTRMLNSIFCDYSDACTLFKGTTVPNTDVTAVVATNDNNK